jgi:hypothetical protein
MYRVLVACRIPSARIHPPFVPGSVIVPHSHLVFCLRRVR